MRTLVVTRGIPACGKSTWIEDHELGAYTISPDAIRLMKDIITARGLYLGETK